MRGTILQPTYLPWAGYFEMIYATDIYVVFDHVQFVRKSWHQRNVIKTSNGKTMLTVPVKKKTRSTPICDIEISCNNNKTPLVSHWKAICLAYRNAPYFKDYEEIFSKIYSTKYKYLEVLNMEIIKAICEILQIETKIRFSSKLNLVEEHLGRTEKIVNLCKKVGISYLYDAKGAQQLLDISLFEKEGITVEFQDYKHPEYSQLFGQFIPYLSVIDLLFNKGQESLEIIRSGSSIRAKKSGK